MNIALVAHDNCKKDLVRWAREHVNELKGHRLTCTGTTGRLIDAALRELLGDESRGVPEIRSARGRSADGFPYRGRQDRRPDLLLGPHAGPAA